MNNRSLTSQVREIVSKLSPEDAEVITSVLAKQEQTLRALSESEERYQAFYDQAPLGYQSLDERGRFIDVNQAWLDVLGYSKDEVVGRWFGDFLAPEFVDVFREQFPLFKARGRVRSEFQMIHKDGGRRCVAFEGLIGHHPDGTFKQTHCILADRTESQRAREALERSERKFKTLFTEAADLMLLLTLSETGEPIVVDANRTALDTQGLSKSEVLGRPITDFDILLDNEQIQNDILPRILSGDAVVFETELTKKDGTRCILEVSAKQLDLDEGYPLVLSVGRDVTTARMYERELTEAQRIAKLGSWYWDISTDTIEGTEEFKRIWDFAPETRRLTFSEAMARIDPRDRDRVDQLLTASIEQKKPFKAEFRLILRDGETRYVRGMGAFEPVPRGASKIFHGTSQDITEERRSQEMLSNQQRLDSLGIVAGGIAHDFNNLLGGVFTNIDLALDSLDDKEYALQKLGRAMGALDRARALTGRLLTFAKGGAPRKRAVAVGTMIDETIDLSLSGSDIESVVKIDPDVPAVHADPNQLSQVLNNIVLNARQAMPGGGQMAIGASFLHLADGDVADLPEGDYVKISVLDQGMGISSSILPKVFDPFFTTKTEGSGLGLSTCYSIVRKHGGALTIDSLKESGTTVSVYLPPCTEDELEDTPDTSEPASLSGRVLVMDDEELILEVAEDVLESLGLEVISARNGDEAVEIYRDHHERGIPIDLVLLDLTITGGMGGEQTMAEIHEIDPSARGIVSSGYGDSPVLSNPEQYGFLGKIAKPFYKHELTTLLEKSLK